jgi:hypothetical protein
MIIPICLKVGRLDFGIIPISSLYPKMKTSLFHGFNTVSANRSLSDLLRDIQTGTYKKEIEKYRDKRDYDLKKKLLAFTPSGVFAGGRKLENLKQYNGLVVLDIDKLSESDLGVVQEMAPKNVLTHAGFVSPSSNGYKILVRTENQELDKHEYVFKRLADYYEGYLGVEVDRSGKDVTRLCFVSHDPELYYNTESELFPEFVAGEDLISRCVEITNRYEKFEDGHRNAFVFRLACNTNRYGVEEDEILEYAIDQYAEFGFGKPEISRTVKSAYENNKEEFGSFASLPHATGDAKNSPYLPDEAFSDLPTLLEASLLPLKEKGNRERDIFFLCALGVMGGIFSEVEGLYDNKPHSPALNVFILAPPASGKGVMTYAEILGLSIHREWLERSKQLIGHYKMMIKLHEKSDSETSDEPVKPKVKMLYIPGNVSSAAIVDHLYNSDGVGVMIETEADTIANNLKQDWGGYSDLIRKSFHHEKVSSSRKSRGQFILDDSFKEIERPKLSIVVTGTPGQLQGLVKSAENGLFSRFIFYTYSKVPKWRDVSVNEDSVDLNKYYEERSLELKKIVEKYESDKHTFQLSKKQWKILNTEMEKLLEQADQEGVDGLISAVTRLGLICYRFAMIFSILRHYDSKSVDLVIKCEDRDFERAMMLVKVLYEHAAKVATMFPEAKMNSVLGHRLKFYSALPDDEFSRSTALSIGKSMKLSERSVDRYLNFLAEQGMLLHKKVGYYEKK